MCYCCVCSCVLITMSCKLQHTNHPSRALGVLGKLLFKYSLIRLCSSLERLHLGSHGKAPKMSQTKITRATSVPFLSDLCHSPLACRGRRQGRFQSRLCSLMCGWAESWDSRAEAGWSRAEWCLRRIKIRFVMAPFPPSFFSFPFQGSPLLEKGVSLGRAVKPLSVVLSLSRGVFPLATDCSDTHKS